MNIPYVIPNFDRKGEIVEVFLVESFYDINGKPIDNVSFAAFAVVTNDGRHHRIDLSSAYVFTLH